MINDKYGKSMIINGRLESQKEIYLLARVIANSLLAIESKLSRFGFGFILSIIILFAVTAVSQFHLQTMHHGNEYTLLSEHPFDLWRNNDLQFRILSPIVAHFLHLRGPLFTYFMIFALAVFLAVTFVFLRKKSFTVVNAGLMTALLGFSTLSFYQFYFPAYTDPTSFLLILLFMMFYDRPVASTVLLSLLLFNHDGNLFLFPFFFLLMTGGKINAETIRSVWIRMVLAAFPYYVFREFVATRTTLNFTLEYYLDPVNLKWTREHVVPNLLNGIFQSFRLTWFIPIAAIAINIFQKRYFELLLILTVFAFVILQFVIAYDISRLAGYTFPAFLLGAIRLHEYIGPKKFMIAAIILFVGNLFVPAFCVGALEPIPYRPGWLF